VILPDQFLFYQYAEGENVPADHDSCVCLILCGADLLSVWKYLEDILAGIVILKLIG